MNKKMITAIVAAVLFVALVLLASGLWVNSLVKNFPARAANQVVDTLVARWADEQKAEEAKPGSSKIITTLDQVAGRVGEKVGTQVADKVTDNANSIGARATGGALTSLRYGLKHFANEVTRLYDKDGITVADNGKASIADDGKPNGDFASATPSILTEAYVKLARQAGFPVKGPVYPKEILAAIKAADAAAAKAKAAEEAAEGGTDDTTASSDSTEGTDAGTGITPEPAKKVQTKKSGLKGLAALRAKKAGANK